MNIPPGEIEMRRLPTSWTVALLAAGCAAITPVTADLRSPETLAGGGFRIMGRFELHTAGRAAIVVKDRAQTLDVVATDDSTLVATVLCAPVTGVYDTLRLTFVESQMSEGYYTLRAVNGTSLGGSIPVGTLGYQYMPCTHTFRIACDRAITAGAREDQQVWLGVLRR
jgi:hypothetical protein